MNCTFCEERLLIYAELDAASRAELDRHLEHCSECLAFRDALLAIDRAIPPLTARADLSARVLACTIARPSRVPELLDAAGVLATFAIAASVLALLDPLYALATLAAALAGAAIWLGARTLSELRD